MASSYTLGHPVPLHFQWPHPTLNCPGPLWSGSLQMGRQTTWLCLGQSCGCGMVGSAERPWVSACTQYSERGFEVSQEGTLSPLPNPTPKGTTNPII